MGKGLPRSTRRNVTQQTLVRGRFPFRALALTVTGATGVGWAAAVPGDFPQGNIYIAAAVSYVQFTKAASATGVQDTFDGDYAIGTTPTADATLSGTDANIIPSSPLGPATSGVSPVARGASSGGAVGTILDNTDGSLELNLNLLIDDANISADSQAVTATGYIEVLYAVLGDD